VWNIIDLCHHPFEDNDLYKVKKKPMERETNDPSDGTLFLPCLIEMYCLENKWMRSQKVKRTGNKKQWRTSCLLCGVPTDLTAVARVVIPWCFNLQLFKKMSWIWRRIFLKSFTCLFYLFLILSSSPFINCLYNSLDSTTFQLQSSKFSLSYLDKTKLSGQICSDLISFGNYSLFGYFGCISPEHQSSYFSDEINGILGFGFPSVQHPKMNLFTLITLSSGTPSTSPSPFSLLLPSIEPINSTSRSHKIFTLILFPNSSQGLMQIGGFDPSQVEKWSHLESDDALPNLNQQITLPILTDCASFVVSKDCPFRNYRVGIQRIRYGSCFLIS
jgi:hypothetical protein